MFLRVCTCTVQVVHLYYIVIPVHYSVNCKLLDTRTLLDCTSFHILT
jgi:hypothetical protein